MRKDLQFGLIYGLGGSVWVLLMWALGFHAADANIEMAWIESLFLIVGGFIIAMGIKSVKKDNGGFLGFGKSFKTGAMIVVIGQLINALFAYIYQNMINGTYVADRTEQVRIRMLEKIEQINAAGIDPEELISASADQLTSPVAYISSFVVGVLLMLIVTLIIAAVLQKKEPNKNEPTKEEIDEFLNSDDISDVEVDTSSDGDGVDVE